MYYFVVDGTKATDAGAFDLTLSGYLVPTISVPAGGLTLDFETQNGGLAAKGDWEWGQYNWTGTGCTGTSDHPTTGQGHVAAQKGMWATVLGGCYSNNNSAQGTCTSGSSDKSDDSILTFNLTLPASWTSAKIEWWEWVDVFTNFDWTEVWVDGKLDTATQVCSGQPAKKWEKKSIDLSAYVGKTVNVAYHLMATGVVNEAGWYIDEIVVSGQ